MVSTPSTASQSPAQSSGKCVVCGKETDMRCSACSENGLDWMFFCSIEHQKLIWFMHKRVCGKNSNPFRWPLLRQDEIDDILRFAKLPAKLPGTSKVSELWEKINPTGEDSLDIGRLAAELPSFEVSAQADEINSSSSKIGILGIRRFSHRLRMHAAHYERPQDPINTHVCTATQIAPFDAMASTLDRSIGRLGQESTATPWSTKHLHLYLVHFAILSLQSRGRIGVGKTRLSLHTYVQLQEFYKAVVSKSHPQQASILSDALLYYTGQLEHLYVDQRNHTSPLG